VQVQVQVATGVATLDMEVEGGDTAAMAVAAMAAGGEVSTDTPTFSPMNPFVFAPSSPRHPPETEIRKTQNPKNCDRFFFIISPFLRQQACQFSIPALNGRLYIFNIDSNTSLQNHGLILLRKGQFLVSNRHSISTYRQP
jgi:hypothetical protein